MSHLLIALIRLYQITLGPLFGGACRFEPSCSKFAIEALEKHGFWKGVRLATGRLLRCHPFRPGGFDPVPPADPCAKAGRGALATSRGGQDWLKGLSVT